MANPVTIDDIEARWRPPSGDAEVVLWQSLLNDAWAILLARVADIDARVTAATLSTPLVVAVETAMVLRVLRNPDGKRQEAIDDYSWTRDNAVSAGLLYATPDEIAVLAPAGALSGAFSITPYSATYVAEAATSTTVAWDVNP